jgi:hypothetical protein
VVITARKAKAETIVDKLNAAAELIEDCVLLSKWAPGTPIKRAVLEEVGRLTNSRVYGVKATPRTPNTTVVSFAYLVKNSGST